MSKLIDFLTDLGQDAELLKDFQESPEQTMKDYGLNDDEIKAVMDRDEDKVRELSGAKAGVSITFHGKY